MDILRAVYKARSGVKWKHNSVNGFSLDTIKAAYIGEDFPNQSELNAAWLLCQEEDRIEGIIDQISKTDRGTIRIVEDLIEILIQKGNISLNDFPSQAQTRLATRKAFRDQISED